MSSPRRRPRRKRIVLASRRRTRPVAKMLMDLEEQTSVGDVLVRHLVRAQLRSSLTLAGITVCYFGSLPLLFWLFPKLQNSVVLGIHLPWLLLAIVPYPVLLLIGYLSTRSAEQHEREFLNTVDR